MSNRAFRRLQQQGNIIPLPVDDDGNSEEDEGFVPSPVSKNYKGKKKQKMVNVNPFELLNEAVDINTEKMEQLETDGKKDDDIEGAVCHNVQLSRPKKKKNRKKEKTNNENERIAVSAGDSKVEDEIEASILEVNQMLGNAGATSLGNAAQSASARDELTASMKALLNVEYKYLNADNEMKRKFGSRVVQPEQGRARHRNRTSQRHWRLVQPKENWPMVGRSGLSMEALEKSPDLASGEQCFSFEHSPAYREIQFQFLSAVKSYDPQNIANLIRDHPYHIDSLLQLSEVFHLHEDPQTAVDLVERALYVFELAFHPRFNLATGVCRIDFRRQENRPFFLALFKHLTAVGQRGCHRTALELCKLLLSLDPDGDPMCVLLLIDYYAILAEEYSFLLRMFQEWESFRNLSQLPNFAFSVSLAMFHLSKGNGNNGMLDKANKMLEESLLMFPGLLMPLLDKCSISPDEKVSGHTFFGPSAQTSQNPALQQLIALYVGRCYVLWKDAEVILWLERIVKATLDLVDAQDARVKSFAEKRKIRYQGTPRNIYRHFIISNIKDVKVTLPPELINTPLLNYDPLPPLDAIVSYSPPPRSQQAASGESTLRLLLRSLLPNFSTQQADVLPGPALEEEEEGAVGGGGVNHELRRGVGVLMDAMRDLLNNIRLVPPPVENGQNGNRGPEDGEAEDGEADEDDDDRGEDGEWD